MTAARVPRPPVAAWLFVLLLLFAGVAHAQDFPKFTGLVTDAAHVIPPDRAAALTQKLQAFQQRTGRQLVVATVPSLGGEEVQQYGVKLLRAWGVGLKGADNGAILLVAPSDRKVGIEVGYGLEGVLTDVYSSVVINSKILPAFKAGDVPAGIDAGADALIDLLSQPDDQARAKQQAAVAAWDKQHARHGGGVAWGLVFWLFVIGFVLLSAMRRRGTRYGGGGSGLGPILMWSALDALSDSRRGGWGGGFGDGGGSSDGGGGWMGGGFTGGGGGSGGGGGASGSW